MMPLTGFYILGAGLTIDFLAGIFLVANMGLGMRGMFRSFTTPMPSIDDPRVRGKVRAADAGGRIVGLFGGHLVAMGAMAFGGFLAAIGVLVAVVQAIQTYG